MLLTKHLIKDHRDLIVKVSQEKLPNYQFNFESLGYLPIEKLKIIQIPYEYHRSIVQISSRIRVKIS
jgi:hypothetical protein